MNDPQPKQDPAWRLATPSRSRTSNSYPPSSTLNGLQTREFWIGKTATEGRFKTTGVSRHGNNSQRVSDLKHLLCKMVKNGPRTQLLPDLVVVVHL